MVNENLPPIILVWRPGLKLIHFYKNFHLEAFTPIEVKFKYYCFGYEGENEIKVIFAIMPNDGVIVTDDVDKLPVQLR